MACRQRGARLIVCSEYGIEKATRAIHPNRALREAGLLATRAEFGGQALDLNASGAFAMCDHQIAHVYVQRNECLPAARERLAALAKKKGRLANELAGVEAEPTAGLLSDLARGLLQPTPTARCWPPSPSPTPKAARWRGKF